MKKLSLLICVIFLLNSVFANDVKLVSWNVETFFDAVTSGDEYKEFRSSSKWNEASYKNRLFKLVEAIKILDADVLVLIELENKEILYDISNMMQDMSFNRNKMYKFSCFAKNSGSAIGCGILSRFELKNLSVHNVFVKGKSVQPDMRPVMRVLCSSGGNDFVLYVNHWKSMSGGKLKTENWRNWQESVLSALIFRDLAAGTKNVVACGDFNRDLFDFSFESKEFSSTPQFFLRHFISKKGIFNYKTQVYSAWFLNGECAEPGSYFYKGNWSRIDNIFIQGSVVVKNFSSVQNELWCTDEGIPEKYSVFYNSGFSDHLPLECVFELN